MSRFFSFVALVAWSLWIGGLIMLFLSVMTLFGKSKSVASEAAPHLFMAFERYQLILAAVALSSTFAWRMTARLAPLNALFVLLALSAFCAAFTPLYVTNRMEALRAEGKNSTPEFQQLHRRATRLYVVEAIVLLIGAFPLYAALRHKPLQLQTGTAPAPAATGPTPS
jgi:hypothetical protein